MNSDALPLVSVIIPVFNTEKYIEDCIFSVINQNYSRLEIIIVNDGSTDGSRSIIQKYMEVDRRIVCIDKKNEGISTGASNDIERATKLAFAMVAQYGMSDTLGPIAYSADDSNVFLGKELGHSKNYSESTAAKIDKEVSDIITTGYNKTEEILKNNIGRLHEVAKFLISNEKMSGDEFKKVMEGASAEELLTELNKDADEV